MFFWPKGVRVHLAKTTLTFTMKFDLNFKTQLRKADSKVMLPK